MNLPMSHHAPQPQDPFTFWNFPGNMQTNPLVRTYDGDLRGLNRNDGTAQVKQNAVENDKYEHRRNLEAIVRRDEQKNEEWHRQNEERQQQDRHVERHRTPEIELELGAVPSDVSGSGPTGDHARVQGTVSPSALMIPVIKKEQ